MQLEERDDKYDKCEAEQAVEPLHLLVGHAPDDDPDGKGDEGDPEEIADVARELQCNGDTADFSSERQEIDEERRAEVEEADPRAEPFTDDVEHGPTGER